jgi:PAS domain S-box-containing protein
MMDASGQILTEQEKAAADIGQRLLLMSSQCDVSVERIMTPEVVTVAPQDTLAAGAQKMADMAVSCVVVLDKGAVVGILTLKDYLLGLASDSRDFFQREVKEVMVQPVRHMAPEQSLLEACQVMQQNHIRRMPVLDHGRLVGIVTQTDIFRATQILEAEYEDGLQRLAGSLSCIFILDADGNTVYMNPALLALLEVDNPAPLLGCPFLPERFWADPDHRRTVMDRILAGDAHRDHVYLKTGQGRPLVVSLVSTLIRNIHGWTYQIQGVLHDITERIEAEQATAEAYDQLRQANHELKQIQAQIVQQEKLASLGQLAAGVAHEMNTPVGFVASNFQTLESYMARFLELFRMYEQLADAVEDGQKEKRLAILEEIQIARTRMKMDFILDDIQQLFDESREGLERVTTIVQSLKDFSHIEQRQEPVDYDVNKGIEATLTVARNEIKYDADLQTHLSEVPLVRCFAGQINQVLLNIIVNAAQAIRNQEGREGRGHIDITTYTTDDHVVCEIRDNGPGIPPEICKKIFDPFFTTKPPGKGTGLGLNVSYDIIVNKHKGQLEVDSTVGRGSLFTIRLPIHHASSLEDPDTSS